MEAELSKLHLLHFGIQSLELARKDKDSKTLKGEEKNPCPHTRPYVPLAPRLGACEGELGMSILLGWGPTFPSDGIEARESCIKKSVFFFPSGSEHP